MRHVRPFLIGFLVCGAAALPAQARRSHHGGSTWQPPSAFDGKIAELSKKHNVPERLIHRVIMRESRYNPAAVHAGNYGLMQIRLGTAKTMGYSGSAMGLCDAFTNLTYAVPYLANAYAVAGRDEDRAVRLYASGFYYAAKRQGALARMQVADAQAEQAAAYAQTAPANPIAALFGAVTAPAQVAVTAAHAESAANAQAMAAAYQTADAEVDAPLPPLRPRAYSTNKFLALAMRQDPLAEGSVEVAQSDPAPVAAMQVAQADEVDALAPLPPHRPRAYSTRAFIRLAMQQEERATSAELRPGE